MTHAPCACTEPRGASGNLHVGRSLLTHSLETHIRFALMCFCRSGESEKQIRAVFEAARALQPCIVFMVRTSQAELRHWVARPAANVRKMTL